MHLCILVKDKEVQPIVGLSHTTLAAKAAEAKAI